MRVKGSLEKLRSCWRSSAARTSPGRQKLVDVGRVQSSIRAMQVRPATYDDLPGILEIYNEAVLNTTATYDYEPRTLEQRHQWFEERRRDDYAVFVALDENCRITGWSALNPFHA